MSISQYSQKILQLHDSSIGLKLTKRIVNSGKHLKES